MAKQSSWFFTFALVMVTPVLLPTSNPSVLCPPRVSPAELSIVISVRDNVVALLTENTWTGLFLMLIPVMEEDCRLCA